MKQCSICDGVLYARGFCNAECARQYSRRYRLQAQKEAI